MNEHPWEQPTGNNIPLNKRLEVVVTDQEENTYVVTGIYDGVNWTDPAGYSFVDYGYKSVKFFRFASRWPDCDQDNRRKKTGRKEK